MNFFCTKEHWDSWTGKMKVNLQEVFCLDAREALQVAEMLFSEKIRPARTENTAFGKKS
ncbi:MAG: hypothetical protein LLG06_16920 [Desulfobacteraceae bacterium]|nr:hypothetical protein [Desulfobacteraceae bacterium]